MEFLVFYKNILTVLIIIGFGIFSVSCSEDSNSPSDNDYTLTQTDLNNSVNSLVSDITGDQYGAPVSIAHGGENLTSDQTIRDVYGNLSGLNDEIEVGTIITKKTYLKDNSTKSDLLVTFAMVKRMEGYYETGGDWDYYMMPYDSTVDYDTNPNGLIANAAMSGKLEYCAGCHAKASDGDFVFIK